MLSSDYSKSFKIFVAAVILISFQQVNAQVDTASLSLKLNRAKDKLGKNVVFLIYKDGKTIYKKESGEFNAKTQQPIGATSQWLTAALVMTFVQEGKISLDDKVSKYLPIFDKYYKGYITIRHCITHYTGIQTEQGVLKLLSKSKYHTLEEEVNDYAAKKEIQTNAGTEFRYSNVGFNIAGRVLEVVSKKNFDRIMRDRILLPSGMKNTTFTSEDYNDAISPATGARSTANDLINFMAMLLNKGTFNNKQVLTESSVAMLHTIQVSPDQMKFIPPTLQGLDYGFGEWILEPNAQGKAGTVGVPSMQGTWPMLDLCRRYACVLFTKESAGEQKRNFYMDLKATIDEGLPAGSCN
jgi:CubicO group peptidase (beta-lactamase class C family)